MSLIGRIIIAPLAIPFMVFIMFYIRGWFLVVPIGIFCFIFALDLLDLARGKVFIPYPRWLLKIKRT